MAKKSAENRAFENRCLIIATELVVLSSGLALSSNDSIAYNEGVETFVNSLYSDCLGRTADPSGFDDWCAKLSSGQVSGKQAAYGFFFSQEFITKAYSLSDDELIDAYYRFFEQKFESVR